MRLQPTTTPTATATPADDLVIELRDPPADIGAALAAERGSSPRAKRTGS